MDHKFFLERDEIGAHLLGSKYEGSKFDESNHEDNMVEAWV